MIDLIEPTPSLITTNAVSIRQKKEETWHGQKRKMIKSESDPENHLHTPKSSTPID